MQQIYDRTGLRLSSTSLPGNYINYLHVPVHGRAFHPNRIHTRCLNRQDGHPYRQDGYPKTCFSHLHFFLKQTIFILSCTICPHVPGSSPMRRHTVSRTPAGPPHRNADPLSLERQVPVRRKTHMPILAVCRAPTPAYGYML